jgi:uncharacterized membrane protein (UPF0127 family)
VVALPRTPGALLIGLLAATLSVGLFLGTRAGAQDDCGGQPYAEVQIDGFPRLNLEVARTPAEHERGLMDRDSMPPDNGMVFVYTSPAREGYWMRDTRIPLSIAWLDQNGTILDIQDMDAFDDQHAHYPGVGTLLLSQAPSTPVLPYYYALETNQGWFAAHGVGVGQQVAFCLGA